MLNAQSCVHGNVGVAGQTVGPEMCDGLRVEQGCEVR